jgi:hypothetical protein
MRREAVLVMQAEIKLSQRRACRLIGLVRGTCRYRKRGVEDQRLRTRLKAGLLPAATAPPSYAASNLFIPVSSRAARVRCSELPLWRCYANRAIVSALRIEDFTPKQALLRILP